MFTSGSIYWANAGEAVMIACEEKYAAFAGAERMLQIVVAQRLPGDDQFFRVQLRGVSRSSSMRIGWVQRDSATVPTTDLHLPDDLMCAVRREEFTHGVHLADNVIVQAKLVATQKKVTYCCEKFDGREEVQLLDKPLAEDVDVSKLFLAAILDSPGDAAYLLPSEVGHSWAPQIVPGAR